MWIVYDWKNEIVGYYDSEVEAMQAADDADGWYEFNPEY